MATDCSGGGLDGAPLANDDAHAVANKLGADVV